MKVFLAREQRKLHQKHRNWTEEKRLKITILRGARARQKGVCVRSWQAMKLIGKLHLLNSSCVVSWMTWPPKSSQQEDVTLTKNTFPWWKPSRHMCCYLYPFPKWRKNGREKKEISKAHLFSLLQLSHVNCTPNYHDVFLHCIALSLI